MKNVLKKQILEVLKEYPQSRDSDQWLTIKIWAKYYPSRIHLNELTNDKYIFLKDIMEMPREDNVKRIRAVIQNEENKFLPTSLKVVKKRKINEQKWKDYLNSEFKRL